MEILITYYQSYNTKNFNELINYFNFSFIKNELTPVTGPSNVCRLICTSPSALKFTIERENDERKRLIEGSLVQSYISLNIDLNGHKLQFSAKDINKKYIFKFELFGNNNNSIFDLTCVINNHEEDIVINQTKTYSINL